MKKILFIVCVLAVNFNLFSQDKTAKINFLTTEIDYGIIEKGSNGVRDFIFTNDGDSPLIITNVKSTCGCTIPKKPNKPILPGETEKIQVKYDTNRVGFIRKSIMVSSNAETPTVILKISGKVTNKSIENGLEKKSKSLLEEGY
ncbi:MAG: DUF1573 domain-containing protein [Bacteroidota bacterium]|nr:DUF1573 domain-containing protein [Bacteroidota bacterium]|tara:strand:+ start:403 stop:834 length:432 start_codon:yes stop_codon:yes gene_type:complete